MPGLDRLETVYTVPPLCQDDQDQRPLVPSNSALIHHAHLKLAHIRHAIHCAAVDHIAIRCEACSQRLPCTGGEKFGVQMADVANSQKAPKTNGFTNGQVKGTETMV